MGWLIFFAIIFFISYLYEKFDNSSDDDIDVETSNNQHLRGRGRSASPARKKPTTAYRPKNSPKRPIDFSSSGQSTTMNTTLKPEDLKDLKDAFTGAPLNPKLGLYKCRNCQVYYHQESYQILKTENNKQCMACGSTNIIAVIEVGKGAKNARPDTITLNNYREYIGKVITFEGQVYSVKESKRGGDFAVMFENKSWTKGFKMVFFDGSISRCGGAGLIKSLAGQRIQVRGLLKKHSTFGYEIIVSNKSQFKVL